MKTPFVALALVASCCAAAPIGAELTKRIQGGGDGNVAYVQFFYDENCEVPANLLPIKVSYGVEDIPQGGAYGSKSAWFAGSGPFVNWGFVAGPLNPRKAPTRLTPTNPELALCFTSVTGIYAYADTGV